MWAMHIAKARDFQLSSAVMRCHDSLCVTPLTDNKIKIFNQIHIRCLPFSSHWIQYIDVRLVSGKNKQKCRPFNTWEIKVFEMFRLTEKPKVTHRWRYELLIFPYCAHSHATITPHNCGTHNCTPATQWLTSLGWCALFVYLFTLSLPLANHIACVEYVFIYTHLGEPWAAYAVPRDVFCLFFCFFSNFFFRWSDMLIFYGKFAILGTLDYFYILGENVKSKCIVYTCMLLLFFLYIFQSLKNDQHQQLNHKAASGMWDGEKKRTRQMNKQTHTHQ